MAAMAAADVYGTRGYAAPEASDDPSPVADLYTVGVLILFVGGVGGAVLVGEYLIRYLSTRRPPA